MDTSIKTLVSVTITFIGMLLLVTCISFFLLSNHARDTMYAVVDYLEVYGYDENTISNYSNQTNTTIEVTPVKTLEGTRYDVQVSFNHVFAFLKMDKHITLTSTTRVVNY